MMNRILNVALTVVLSALGINSWFLHSVRVSIPLVAFQQDPRTGNFPNEPPEYADGVMCSPKGDIFKGLQTPDHPCHCKNMWRDSDTDGENCCDERVTNDSTCLQWCHEKHCACPKICIPGKADETAAPQNDGDRR